jgi:hypothetical protein
LQQLGEYRFGQEAWLGHSFSSSPYHLEWLNNSGKVKVTKSAGIQFSVGLYHDYADFDIVPMQASSLLLG